MADNPVPSLHLGITMAGAVSAGAYTAGVIDFLFEALQDWEAAKKKEENLPAEEKKVPPHRVQIEVLGGASAGGITAALTALTCFTGINPVDQPEDAKAKNFRPSNNMLFDAWVNLGAASNAPEGIFRMLDTDDLKKAGGIPSLLNSLPIDEIADRALQHTNSTPKKPWPAFVAKDVEVLLTLCSLRGIPVGINFNSDNSSWIASPSHQMSIHKQYARFTPKTTINDPQRAIPFDRSEPETLQQLIDCAKATAAFPIGFQAREITLSRNHVKHQFGTFYQFNEKTLDSIFESGTVPDPFEFTSIDGGALNNEPLGEIAAIMHERKIRDFALILVDPFPNFGGKPEKYKPLQFLRQLLFPIMGALRNQGMLKESDLREVGQEDELKANYKKNMIYPSRWTYNEKAEDWDKCGNALACGGLGGFSGILSRNFRLHDYFLGRQNCRNFLRSYFTIEYKTKPDAANHAIFQDWTPEMVNTYKVAWRESREGVVHLPIIPVLDFVREENEKKQAFTDDPEKREAALLEHARKSDFAFPTIQPTQLIALRKPLRRRMFKMAHKATNNWNLLIRWAFRALLFVMIPVLFAYLARRVIKAAQKDLIDNGLVRKG